MNRILIADEATVFRQGLCNLLEMNLNNMVIESCNFDDLDETLKCRTPTILILEIGLLKDLELNEVVKLKNLFPEMLILVLSSYLEEKFAVKAMTQGASGYITKDCNPKNILQAINILLSGLSPLTEKVLRLLTAKIRELTDKNLDRINLSPRENEILLALASGKTMTAIAQSISLSVKTVSTYRTRILKKLDLNNNAEIIRYVLNNRTFG